MNVDRIQYGYLAPTFVSAPLASSSTSTPSAASTSAATSDPGGPETDNLTTIIAGAVSGGVVFISLIIGAITYARSCSKTARLDEAFQESEGNNDHARPQSLETVHPKQNSLTSDGTTDFSPAFPPTVSGCSTPLSPFHLSGPQSGLQKTPGDQSRDSSHALHPPRPGGNCSTSRANPPAPHRSGAAPGSSGVQEQAPRRPNVLVRPPRARIQIQVPGLINNSTAEPQAKASRPRCADAPPSYYHS
ncbi:hypothetical protein BOTBODRAFT_565798 [Botryobasidium botryosum FD-172 SS1]|uniref:Uncharacterized protein n=1 Tax=Botryobasidium botryosum (strain FD-172 SS1) TaxID=930990 RepID=A0A067MA33_BOTB1|nr:hypothetical protein BOTBODRAFT_565798 [Botryobasidium botryosum FD-172 SS1]